VLKGDAEALIPALAKRKGIELIVMGTVCRTGIAGFIVGNTAENILQQVDCSVLTVKPEGFVSPGQATVKGGGMKHLEKVERVIVLSLLVMMISVVLLSTIELGWVLIKDIITPPVFLLEISELLDLFGIFLLVSIGVDLLETVKMYLSTKTVHVEVVFAVAMIAIARDD
jgi:hypothetical protein